ncbi:hypothetical protein ACIOHC_36210 [Streptomyces sp. NPDC088252]|uniref:hypothetical protein n=1 Tax=Streptomyces sp. NPDC088252 TaxID=3365845 RepID=UPI003806D517
MARATSDSTVSGHELKELVARWQELEVGVDYPVINNFCKYCQSTQLVFVVKLVAVPGALAGMQVKASGQAWPYLRCTGCGHESKGK